MELHLALKQIVSTNGRNIVENPQIINHLLDYRCFVDKPAMKLILRDIINSGYATEILALNPSQLAWQTKFKHYVHDFIDACGYREELATYVFESIAYSLDLNVYNEEPKIRRKINIDSFFDITDEEEQNGSTTQQSPVSYKLSVDPKDAYTIALSFFKESKYQQAKAFAEKAINNIIQGDVPPSYYKLMGDILMKINDYEGAISNYNDCLKNKANEDNITADQLRESLFNHEIKGYENFIYFYFLCLYNDKRIPETKWLSVLREEARKGSFEAILHCANHAIDPIENHTDIYFYDTNQLRSGDYLYEDGTFAHELSNSKKAMAIVFLTETSDYEKELGFTKGYIVALEAIGELDHSYSFRTEFKGVAWSTLNVNESFPHSHYTVDDLAHWDDIDKIDSESMIVIKKNELHLYPAFKLVEDYDVKIPLTDTSGWFLPNVLLIEKITSDLVFRQNMYLMFKGSPCPIWTSSQADKRWCNYI